MGKRTTQLQDAEHPKVDQTEVDRIEKEVAKVLYRIYPSIGKVIVALDAIRGRMFIVAGEEVWILCPGQRWITRLYRALDTKNFRGLSRQVEAHFRSPEIHLAVSQFLLDYLQRIKQQATSGETWPGIPQSWN